MVGLGMLFVLLSALGTWFCWRGNLFEQKWLLAAFVPSVILPHVANQLGWFVAEVGRQPWIVQGLLKTRDSFSPAVDKTEMILSLGMFMIIYVVLGGLFFFILDRRIKLGPGYFADDGDSAGVETEMEGGES
jgi:cytochrome d ubiquinol oxidase subunit I